MKPVHPCSSAVQNHQTGVCCNISSDVRSACEKAGSVFLVMCNLFYFRTVSTKYQRANSRYIIKAPKSKLFISCTSSLLL